MPTITQLVSGQFGTEIHISLPPNYFLFQPHQFSYIETTSDHCYFDSMCWNRRAAVTSSYIQNKSFWIFYVYTTKQEVAVNLQYGSEINKYITPNERETAF